MFKRLKNFVMVPVLLLTVIVMASPLTAHAQDVAVNQPDVGVSTKCPDIEERSTNRPSKVWNIKTKGRYDFSGTANVSTLYTNYQFTGKSSYTVYVKNTGKYPITVTAKRLLKTYASTKISAGKSGTITFSNINSDTDFYVVFQGSSFSGYVK